MGHEDKEGVMTYEVSSGAVVFTRESGILRYVIVRSLEGYYGFPKGHIEGKETEEEAAIREIRGGKVNGCWPWTVTACRWRA